MISPDLAFQRVAFAAISAALPSVTVTAHATPNQACPFIHIGESNSTDWPVGDDTTVTVHSWSTAEGPHEIKEFQHAIKGALEDNLGSDLEWVFTAIHEEYRSAFLDIDGETWHGVQRFRVYINPVT